MPDSGTSCCFPRDKHRHLPGQHRRQLPRHPQRPSNPISAEPEQYLTRELGRHRFDDDDNRNATAYGCRIRFQATRRSMDVSHD